MAEIDTVLEEPDLRFDRSTLIAVDGLRVTYEVYLDYRPTLRKIIANRFRPREYREIRAVNDVSFEVRSGECVGIIGRNGSGKSTLLRAMTGLLPAKDGAVYARSIPVLLGVSAALVDVLPGRENIILGGTALGMSREEVEERYDEIVEFAGVGDFIDVPLRAYSSGMVARLAFSIATAVRPEILLIDEALSVGDAEFRDKSQRRIQDLVDAAGAVFIVSHELGYIHDLCTRAIWLDQGRIMEDGEVDRVIEAYTEATGTAERSDG